MFATTLLIAPAAALPLLALPAMMIAAAVTDIREYRIPNWTSAGLALGGLLAIAVACALAGMTWQQAATQLGVGAAALAIGFALFALGVWGGGDGKLIGAAALWFDPGAVGAFALYTALAGAGVALTGLGLFFFRVQLWRIPALRALPVEKWASRTPYGVAIAIGALAAFPETLLFRLILG